MTSTERIRVMVADDHPFMRNGLREALDAEEDFEVVAQASDGVEAVNMAERVEPEVIVMDVMMPVKDGVDACREIMEMLPDTHVLMLTASTAEDAVVEAVAAGATGYLQKHSGPEELAVAIREVAQGRLRIPERSVRRVFAMISGQRGDRNGRALDVITNREREIPRSRAILRTDQPLPCSSYSSLTNPPLSTSPSHPVMVFTLTPAPTRSAGGSKPIDRKGVIIT